jgi:hypothetical protein
MSPRSQRLRTARDERLPARDECLLAHLRELALQVDAAPEHVTAAARSAFSGSGSRSDTQI